MESRSCAPWLSWKRGEVRYEKWRGGDASETSPRQWCRLWSRRLAAIGTPTRRSTRGWSRGGDAVVYVSGSQELDPDYEAHDITLLTQLLGQRATGRHRYPRGTWTGLCSAGRGSGARGHRAVGRLLRRQHARPGGGPPPAHGQAAEAVGMRAQDMGRADQPLRVPRRTGCSVSSASMRTPRTPGFVINAPRLSRPGVPPAEVSTPVGRNSAINAVRRS